MIAIFDCKVRWLANASAATSLRLARKLARSPELITEATFDALRGLGYSDPQIMEILSTAGMFVMNATVISALSLDPP